VKRGVKEEFGKAIRMLREERNLSQQELADYAEIDRTYISDLERGLYFPSLEIVFKLADVFKIEAHLIVKMVDYKIKN
jgi:transcriptional regulator with XRE-family HTH domain